MSKLNKLHKGKKKANIDPNKMFEKMHGVVRLIWARINL